MNENFLSGIIPKLFADFWNGNNEPEKIIEEHIKEKTNGKENNSRENCIHK